MAYISKITPLGSSESYDISAMTVKITDTIPTAATTYYLTYTSGKTENTNFALRANADLYYYDTGTSSYLNVGSSSNSGGLTLHNANGKYGDIITSAFTENRTFTLPNKTGTIALTSDLSGYVLKAGDTMTGMLTNSTNIWAGIDANGNNVSSGECDIGTGGPSGKIYFFNTSGGRGIYGFNSSSAGAYILTVDSNNNVSLNGNAATATLPLGFSSRTTNATWGNTTGTTVTSWNDSSGGSIDFRKDNPSSGKLSIKVDGRFYGNEGTYPAMLMNYNNGYWGLGSDPDGGYSGWVRAPASGILTSAKNASSVGSGVGAIGAIEWRFAHVYADTLHGNAETATKANGLVDGSSTMTSAYNKAGLAYGDYTWLAGWNGYELRAVNKSQFAQASHSHAYLPLAGGTMNDERAITFQITRKKNGGGGWAYSPISMIGNDNAMFFNIGVYGSANTLGYAYIGANGWDSTANTRIYADGHLTAPKVYGAVWNDYAEYRKDNPNEIQEPGRCVKELGNGALALTTKRLERGCEIISDTFGFAIGQDEENGYNTPIASNGRVLAYPYESIEEFANHIGWPVCSGPNGTVSIMTEEEEEKYSSRIIGTISEIPTYEEWGTGKVKVDGRVWIRIR